MLLGMVDPPSDARDGEPRGRCVCGEKVTIGTIVGLTLAAARGGYQVRGEWLERWGNTITAATLIVIGVLVLTGAI